MSDSAQGRPAAVLKTKPFHRNRRSSALPADGQRRTLMAMTESSWLSETGPPSGRT
ncbi:hypothetical protein ACIPLC_37205 [Kitasatospora sp. NPDC086801]|uniref:hypothetical protein n=1 Tax=Kitasatospora sp. NPDC086801 TaxID=3364066 RepID=UPI0037F62B02